MRQKLARNGGRWQERRVLVGYPSAIADEDIEITVIEDPPKKRGKKKDAEEVVED